VTHHDADDYDDDIDDFLMSQIEDSGSLGELSFREDGRRQGYVIGIYGLANSGLIQV